MDCDSCNGEYSQIFYVGWGNKRFPHERYGYLPPICPNCPKKIEQEKMMQSSVPPEPDHLPQQIDHLRAQNVYLQGKVNSHIDKKRVKQEVQRATKGISYQGGI